jgi:hypothetical protein
MEINLEPSLVHSRFDEHRYGRVGDLVPPLVDEILSGKIQGSRQV